MKQVIFSFAITWVICHAATFPPNINEPSSLDQHSTYNSENLQSSLKRNHWGYKTEYSNRWEQYDRDNEDTSSSPRVIGCYSYFIPGGFFIIVKFTADKEGYKPFVTQLLNANDAQKQNNQLCEFPTTQRHPIFPLLQSTYKYDQLPSETDLTQVIDIPSIQKKITLPEYESITQNILEMPNDSVSLENLERNNSSQYDTIISISNEMAKESTTYNSEQTEKTPQVMWLPLPTLKPQKRIEQMESLSQESFTETANKYFPQNSPVIEYNYQISGTEMSTISSVKWHLILIFCIILSI